MYQFKEVTTKSIGAHRDYQENLRHSENFCQNVKKQLINGLKVKICDSEHLPKALMIISWNPGMKAQQGNHATPIFLHQEKETVTKEIQNVFNRYVKKAQEFEKNNPRQFPLGSQ